MAWVEGLCRTYGARDCSWALPSVYTLGECPPRLRPLIFEANGSCASAAQAVRKAKSTPREERQALLTNHPLRLTPSSDFPRAQRGKRGPSEASATPFHSYLGERVSFRSPNSAHLPSLSFCVISHCQVSFSGDHWKGGVKRAVGVFKDEVD